MSSQGYEIPKLKTSIKKFYGRHHELVDPYGITMSQLIADVFPKGPRISVCQMRHCTPILLNTGFENLDVMTGDTHMADDAHSSGAPDSTPGFLFILLHLLCHINGL